jgi:hypothetical protein
MDASEPDHSHKAVVEHLEGLPKDLLKGGYVWTL